MPELFQRDDGQRFVGSSKGFKNRCYTFLVVLCNDRDFKQVRLYLDPNCVLIHEDDPPLEGPDAFVTTWQQTLETMPNYHKSIQDMIYEGRSGETRRCSDLGLLADHRSYRCSTRQHRYDAFHI